MTATGSISDVEDGSVGDGGLESETNGFDLTDFELDNESGGLSAREFDKEAGNKKGTEMAKKTMGGT